ncbi:MAG: ABC transporter ATP-binding protein [Candidatus Acidiferrales bacterium]
MAIPAIEFRNVTKTYRRRIFGRRIPALSDVSFDVSPGEVCAFLGPNGAGKTTSISILMGFVYADSGEIRVLGCLPGDVRAKCKIGFVPENFAFYKHLTGPKLLRFHFALAGAGSADAEALIPDLLSKVKLTGYEDLKIGRYSRGMVQRLGIAQAMLANPDLLMLDEPTSGLDPAGRKEVRDLILSLKAAGKTIFLSSHILSEVEQICDRVVIIDRGKVVRAGRLDEMLGPSDQVEITVNHLPESVEPAIIEEGATVERGSHGVRITVSSARKREMIVRLWAAGSDVISMIPKRSSLEEMFLKLVGNGGGPA